jgi:hypothetical protein
MEVKYTKGKWEARPTMNISENGNPLYYDIIVNGATIASTHKNIHIEGMDDEQQLANAKLIASAPELLAALIEMVDVFDREHSELEQGNVIYYANSIIQKATTI